MAANKDLTPNGCRIDNGRCFTRLEWEEDTRSVYAYFTDGSEYRYFGLGEQEARDWIGMQDPGCYFNFRLWPGHYQKIRGPN